MISAYRYDGLDVGGANAIHNLWIVYCVFLWKIVDVLWRYFELCVAVTFKE